MNILQSSLYRACYDVIRKNSWLNHAAHKCMQSEWIYRLPGYTRLYRRLIEVKSRRQLVCPPFLEFTVTDMCNSNCIMCPREVRGGNTVLDDGLFRRVVTEAQQLGIQKMILTGGEPLLDEQIFAKIRFAKMHGFTYVHMFTNGSLLTAAAAEQLIESGLDSLTISVDSAVKEEYEKIRIGLRFDVVLENIRRLMRLKREHQATQPLVRVNMVALPENSNSRQLFRALFAPIADIVEIIDAHNFAGEVAECLEAEYGQKSRFPCHLMFQKAVITCNGMLKKCSIDNAPGGIVADLNRSSLATELAAGMIVKLKQRMKDGDFSISGCERCTHKESWWVDY